MRNFDVRIRIFGSAIINDRVSSAVAQERDEFGDINSRVYRKCLSASLWLADAGNFIAFSDLPIVTAEQVVWLPSLGSMSA